MADPTPGGMQELTHLALVGTANVPTDAASLPEIDALLPAGGREQRLLWAAGSAATYHRAGRQLATCTPPPAAPTDQCAEVPAHLWRQLHAIINGETAELGAWIVPRLQHHHYRLPANLLPLALSQSKSELWLPVLGERGQWLAAQHPDWRTVLHNLAPQVVSDAQLLQQWEEADFANRCRALAEQRRRDAGLARTWMTAALAQEKAEQRLALTEILADGLCAADEPMLERLLDDRSQAVRQCAAGLLAQLPGSACAARMASRAATCIKLDAQGWQVEPPTALPKDWERDGILANPPHGEGKRAFWLRQLLALIPPRYWIDHAATSAANLLPALQSHEWSEAMVNGIAVASGRFGDGEWAAALLASAMLTRPALVTHVPRLWQIIAPATRDRMTMDLLGANRISEAIIALQENPAPWQTTLTDAIITALTGKNFPQLSPNEFSLHALLLEMAVLHAADHTLNNLLPVAKTMMDAAENTTDWSATQRAKQAGHILVLLDTKLTIIKEMPL